MNCSRPNCPGTAIWRPLLCMRVSVKSPEVIGRMTKLAYCEMHKDELHLKDFLSESSWDKIMRHMREAGKPAPKRNLTTLRYELIASPESTNAEELAF
jgi:hypothetical protein